MGTPLIRWSETGLRLLLGGVFVVAGVEKAAKPGAFFTAIENYRMLPHALAMAAAFYLPYLEILCGGCLLLRRWQAGALAIMGGLMLIFIAALAFAWGRGLNIACGCFGEGGEPGRYGLALTRDLALLIVLGWLWRQEQQRAEALP